MGEIRWHTTTALSVSRAWRYRYRRRNRAQRLPVRARGEDEDVLKIAAITPFRRGKAGHPGYAAKGGRRFQVPSTQFGAVVQVRRRDAHH